MALLTFASTFMAADTAAQLWQPLQKSRVALICFAAWMGAFVLSVVDTDWLTTLGLCHAIFFVVCWLHHQQSAAHASSEHADYVQIPLTVYVPAYTALYLLQSWLW